MNNSDLAMKVINNITSKTISSDASFPLGASQSFVHTSGFMAIAGDQKDFEVKTITTTGAQPYGGLNTSVPLTSNGSWQYTIPNTWSPNLPYIGDLPSNNGWPVINPPPFAPAPIVYPLTGTIKIIPDLELLEEGVHDIKGGKVIIKKIKITEEQIEEALEEEIGHKPTDEEKKQLHQDLEQIAASEEREV